MQTFCDRIKNPDKQWAPPYLDPSHDGDLGIDSVKVMYGAYVSAERGGAHVRIDQPV